MDESPALKQLMEVAVATRKMKRGAFVPQLTAFRPGKIAVVSPRMEPPQCFVMMAYAVALFHAEAAAVSLEAWTKKEHYASEAEARAISQRLKEEVEPGTLQYDPDAEECMIVAFLTKDSAPIVGLLPMHTRENGTAKFSWDEYRETSRSPELAPLEALSRGFQGDEPMVEDNVFIQAMEDLQCSAAVFRAGRPHA